MTQVVMDKKEEIVMKLTHFLITKENYTPIVVNGTKNEVWLENQEGPYKIIRINSNYIHNNEQYKFDLFKIRNITSQVKKKTLSFKMNVLNIFLDINDDIKLDDVKNIHSISIKNSKDLLKNETLKETFPKIDSELLQEKNNIDLLINVTNDINMKSAHDNKVYEETFKPKKIIITPILIALCCVCFVLELIFPELLSLGANNHDLVASGQYYRLFTSTFLHVNIIHLLCNMYSLYIIGRGLENFLGKFKYTIVYLVSLIASSLMSIVFSNSYSVGASGAIFGLLGALLYFGYNYRLYLGSVMKSQIIPVIIMNLLLGFTLSGIDNAAHIGGLIGGFLCLMALGITGKENKSEMINGAIVLTLYLVFLGYMGLFA